VNTTRDTLTNATVEAVVYDVGGTVPYSQRITGVTIEAKKTMIIDVVPLFKSINKEPVYFLLLKLSNSSQTLVSRNFYWLHPTPGNYKQLGQAYRSNKIDVLTTATATIKEESYNIRVVVKNGEKPSGIKVLFSIFFMSEIFFPLNLVLSKKW